MVRKIIYFNRNFSKNCGKFRLSKVDTYKYITPGDELLPDKGADKKSIADVIQKISLMNESVNNEMATDTATILLSAIVKEKNIGKSNKLYDSDAKKSYFIAKRIMDIILASIALIVLSPLMLIVAVAIRIDSEGSAIFKQKRVGKDGKEFTFYKFRSMCENAERYLEKLLDKNEMDKIVFKIKDDPRVTRVGKFIRRTSIDELPQLINILNGTMSIVGPRPPLPREVAEYNTYQLQRLSVKGGLTCYWQISGRNSLGFDDWVELDLKYIEEMSILTDIKMIFRTFRVLFKQDGR